MCGVNGNGKTTTIGKIAQHFRKQGHNVAIAACDTFRAAAVEQLRYWSDSALLINGKLYDDPASVAYKAMMIASEHNIDILLIDTAGRLANQVNLMNQLTKIVRTIKKINDHAPHYNTLVLDATSGQNACSQVEKFTRAIDINSLIVTKLDGTAKAGALIGISQQYHIPIHYIGIGEHVNDLKPFDPKAFVSALIN